LPLLFFVAFWPRGLDSCSCRIRIRADGNGEVDFDEFHEWSSVHQHQIEKIWQPRVRATFTVEEPTEEAEEAWVSIDLQLPNWARPGRPDSMGRKNMSPEEERAEALDLFREIDLDNSGALDMEEIKHLSTAMGASLSDEQALVAMRAMGSNGEQEIDFDSFFLWWLANQSSIAGMRAKLVSKVKLRSRTMRPGSAAMGGTPASASSIESLEDQKAQDEIRRFFNRVDENGNSLLDRQEVRALSLSLGTELSEKELDAAMDAMDPANSGVDFVKFSSWYVRVDPDTDSGGSVFKRGFKSFFTARDSSTPTPKKKKKKPPVVSEPAVETPRKVYMDPAIAMRRQRRNLKECGTKTDGGMEVLPIPRYMLIQT
jgi:Ca2+-binding EF-hand superfamily protein